MVVSIERWVGKLAVVTGASSGIGAAIVKLLIENGINVVGIARRSERIEEQAKKLSDKKGKLYAIKADLTKENEIIDAFKWIKENLGAIHILINNAGMYKETTLVDGNTEMWRKTFDLNVMALCICTKEAINNMKDFNVNNGHIIHINSILGHGVINFPNLNIYPASKHAVTALTETIRLELIRFQSKIKITSISPGLVASEMSTMNPDYNKEKKAMFEKLPILQAEDIADAVIYVLSTPEHVQVHDLIIKPVGEAF